MILKNKFSFSFKEDQHAQIPHLRKLIFNNFKNLTNKENNIKNISYTHSMATTTEQKHPNHLHLIEQTNKPS